MVVPDANAVESALIVKEVIADVDCHNAESKEITEPVPFTLPPLIILKVLYLEVDV